MNFQLWNADRIDISGHTSYNIDEYRNIGLIITVCKNAKKRCRFFPTKAQKIHYNFHNSEKPIGIKEEINGQFREVLQSIKDYYKNFLEINLYLVGKNGRTYIFYGLNRCAALQRCGYSPYYGKMVINVTVWICLSRTEAMKG